MDPKRTGKIFIKNTLTSTILTELYELRQERFNPEELGQNWYCFLYVIYIIKKTLFIGSQYICIIVYEKYLKLDIDLHDLRKYELVRYIWGLINIFIDRIFEEYQTF